MKKRRATKQLKNKKAYFTTALLMTAQQLEWATPQSPQLPQLLMQFKRLIRLKADINASYKNCTCGIIPRCKDAAPPLCRVVRHIAAVQLLLDAHVRIDTKNARGETALLRALQTSQSFAVVQLLLRNKADINTLSWVTWNCAWPDGRRVTFQEPGSTPLMSAIDRYTSKNSPTDIELIQFLITAGAQVDKRNQKGETALMKAVQDPALLPVVTLLLNSGANPQATNAVGESVLHYAHPTILPVLRSSKIK